MGRLVPSLVLAVLALNLLWFHAAWATSYFDVQSRWVSPLGERVKVFADANDLYGNCPITGPNCHRTEIRGRVTPCPPGMPCTNGAYEFVLDGVGTGYSVEMDLAPNTAYTFDGEYRWEIGAQNTPCVFECLFSEIMQPRIHETPPASVAQLNLTVVSSSPDTMWVDLGLSGVNDQVCNHPNYCIVRTEMSYNVTPCVLAAPNAWLLCNGEGATIGEISTPQRLALKPGITYTISAGFAMYGYAYGFSGYCDNLICGSIEHVDLEYTATPVRTRPTTWGKVKSLYRSP